MIIVVEPHADDAYLSLGQHIENWVKKGKSVSIVTVYSGTRKRAVDAQAYARAVGASWYGLGFVECGGGNKGKPELLPKDLGLPVGTSERILLPLALTHPEHKAVNKALFRYAANYYLDAPYQIAQKNSPLVDAALHGTRIVSFCKPSIRKWRHIPLFKDQQLFFRYNPPERLRECFELVVDKR